MCMEYIMDGPKVIQLVRFKISEAKEKSLFQQVNASSTPISSLIVSI